MSDASMIPGRYQSWSLQRGPRLLCFAAMMGLLAVCGPSAADPSDPTKILVKDFMFAPTPLTIKAGSTVTWTNMDDEPHTAVSDTGLFKSGAWIRTTAFRSSSTSPALITTRVRSILA